MRLAKVTPARSMPMRGDRRRPAIRRICSVHRCERRVTIGSVTRDDAVATDPVVILARSMTETDAVTTDTSELDTKVIDEAVIDEALRLIDGGLSDLLHRELVSTDEVADLLLDVRTS